MALTEEEKREFMELNAKAEGTDWKAFVKKMAKKYGILEGTESAFVTPHTTEKIDPNLRFANNLMERYDKGEVSLDQMLDKMMKYQMMQAMFGGGTGGFFGGSKKQDNEPSAATIIATNDEKWERRLEQMKVEQKVANLQRELDDTKPLILSLSGSKKDELTDKFDKLSEKLDEEKTKRFDDALANKSAEISQLREDMQGYFEELRIQPAAKSADEGFFEMMQKMEKFDNMVRSRGKALGMTNEQIEKEVESATPMKQQIIKDVFKTVNRYIDAVAGKKTTEEEVVETAQAATAQIVCKNCGNASDNGTEYCNPCCWGYAEQQQAKGEAEAMRQPEKPPEKSADVQAETSTTEEPAIQ